MHLDKELRSLSLLFFENKGATALRGWNNGNIHMPGPAPGDVQSPLLIILLSVLKVPCPAPGRTPWEAAATVPPTGDAHPKGTMGPTLD